MKINASGTTVGVAAYLFFLILFFPADRAYSLVKEKIPVVLYDVSGTLWEGRAGAGVLERRVLRALGWSLHPWALLLGRVDLGVVFDSGDIKGEGVVGFSLGDTLRLSDIQAQLPPSELQAVLAPKLPQVVQLQGLVHLTADKILVNRSNDRVSHAKASLTWNDAAISGFKEPLGAFRVDFDTVDGMIVGLITSEGTNGPVVAEGKLTLKDDGQYDVNIRLTARDRTRQDVVQALRFLGKSDTEGSVTIVQKGSL